MERKVDPYWVLRQLPPMPYPMQLLGGVMRVFVMDKIKKPLMKAIITLASRYPEPTRENCLDPNVHVLLDIQDEFFEHEDMPCREALFRAIWRIFIAEYAHDSYYKFRIDWIKERLSKSPWEQPSSWKCDHWE